MPEIWVNSKYKYEYFVTSFTKKFCLIQVNGSLGSALCYASKEEAIRDGWRVK